MTKPSSRSHHPRTDPQSSTSPIPKIKDEQRGDKGKSRKISQIIFLVSYYQKIPKFSKIFHGNAFFSKRAKFWSRLFYWFFKIMHFCNFLNKIHQHPRGSAPKLVKLVKVIVFLVWQRELFQNLISKVLHFHMSIFVEFSKVTLYPGNTKRNEEFLWKIPSSLFNWKLPLFINVLSKIFLKISVI